MLTPIPQWVGVLLIATALLGSLALAHGARRRAAVSPETSRKIMHVAMGAAALAYPVLFRDAWPAWLIAGLTACVLLLLRHGALGDVGATVVHGVARRSAGDLYFPLGAAILFTLVRGGGVLYAVPLLTLTLADTAAAWAGRRFGHTRFGTAAERAEKSVEGSLAFLVVAFCSAIGGLSIAAGVTPSAILIAAAFAVLATIIEAASWRGLDNLFIPLGGWLVLGGLVGLDARPVATILAIATAMIAVVASLPPRRTTWRGVTMLLRERRAIS